MKSNNMINMKATLKAALAGAVIAWLCWQTGNVCNAQTTSQNLSPDLQEVVKLSQSHMGDDVIVNYIRSSGKSYRLSADDIIYLSGQGVSQGVISALQTTTVTSPNPAPAISAPVAQPPGPPPAPPVVAAAPAPRNRGSLTAGPGSKL